MPPLSCGSSAITEKLCPWGAGNCWKRATSARKGLAQPESARRAAAGAAMIAIFLNKLIRAILSRHRSEEHTSELQSLMRSSYAVFCLKKKKTTQNKTHTTRNVLPKSQINYRHRR